MSPLAYTADSSCPYKSLDDAIAACDDGGTILVAPGIYNESFTIGKKITLRGDADIGEKKLADCAVFLVPEGNHVLITADAVIQDIVCASFTKKTDFTAFVKDQTAGEMKAEQFKDSIISSDTEYDTPENRDNALVCVNGNASVMRIVTLNAPCYGISVIEGRPEIRESFFIASRYDNAHVCGSSRPIVETCRFIASFEGNGMKICETAHATVIHSLMTGNSRNGISLSENSDTVITDTIGQNNAEIGFSAFKNASVRLFRCDSVQNKYGFYATGNSEVLFDRCCSRNNQISGYLSEGAASVKYTGCDSHDNKISGFDTTETASADFDGCTANANHDGFVCQGDTHPLLKNCSADENLQYGFVGNNNASPVFASCTAHADGKSGFAFYVNSKADMTGCEATRNKLAGIFFISDVGGTVKDCSFCKNEETGVRVQKKADPHFRKCTVRDNGRGIIAMEEGSPVIEECVSVHNFGPAVSCKDDSSCTVLNSLLYNGRRGDTVELSENAKGTFTGLGTLLDPISVRIEGNCAGHFKECKIDYITTNQSDYEVTNKTKFEDCVIHAKTGFPRNLIFENCRSTKYLLYSKDKSCGYKSLNEAIADAEEGTTIYVGPGMYRENVNVNKKVKIVGLNPVRTSQLKNAVRFAMPFETEEDVGFIVSAGAVIENIMISAPYGDLDTFIANEDTLQHLLETTMAGQRVPDDKRIFFDHEEDVSGHFGIVTVNADAKFINVVILYSYWMGVKILSGSPEFRDCLFTHNYSDSVLINGNAAPLFYNCTIRTSAYGYSVDVLGSAEPVFEKCSIIDNDYVGINAAQNAHLTLTECTVQKNRNHNVLLKNNAEITAQDCTFGTGKFDIVSENAKGVVADSLFKILSPYPDTVSADISNKDGKTEKPSAVEFRNCTLDFLAKNTLYVIKKNGEVDPDPITEKKNERS